MRRKRSFFSFFYNNKLISFLLSISVNLIFLAIIVLISKYSKIKGEQFSIIIAVIMVVLLFLNVIYLIGFAKKKRIYRQIFFAFGTILFLMGTYGGAYIVRASRSLGDIVNNNATEVVDYSVIAFDVEFTKATMDKQKLGYIKQDEVFDSMLQDEVEKYSPSVIFVEYQDYHELLSASLLDEIEYALVPKDFNRLEESFDLDESETLPLKDAHTIFSFSLKVGEEVSDVRVLEDPFSILLLGNNEGLSDSIILATFNPHTLKATMTSLARDSYVPIACYAGNKHDKLNHARAVSRQCIVDTIENFLDVEIDFYFETDFYALQKMVDALGGIELESPVAFAGSLPLENNPKEYEPVSVPKGLSLMNGKQAITFARERHHMPRGDFDRQLNQQYVIKELANNLIKERNPEKLVSALEGASKNITMNLGIDDISALLGFAIQQVQNSPLDVYSTFRVVQTQIAGATPTINGMAVVLPYVNDLKLSKDLIRNNLLSKPELKNQTGMSFDIRKPFLLMDPEKPLGSDATGGTVSGGRVYVVPNFGKMNEGQAREWAKSNAVSLNFTVIGEGHGSYRGHYAEGQIIHQSVNPGEYAKKINQINLSIVQKNGAEKPIEPQKPAETVFKVENFVDHSLTNVALTTWAKEHNIVLTEEKVTEGNPLFNKKALPGIVVAQSVKAGSSEKISEIILYTVEFTIPDKSLGFEAIKYWASDHEFNLVYLEEGTGRALSELEASAAEKIVHIKPDLSSKTLVMTFKTELESTPQP